MDSGKKKFSIAIDGTAASGKSTVAKLLAEELGISYLDTGKLYRAVALHFLKDDTRSSQDWEKDDRWLQQQLDSTRLELSTPPAGECRILLNGEDVNGRLADLTVEQATPFAARIPAVRDFLLDAQRQLAEGSSVVMAGRDIGTVVLPQATLKVFIEADLKERARRRLAQHADTVTEQELEKAAAELASRDEKDAKRKTAPMVAAPDAVKVDSTQQTPEQIVAGLKKALGERI